MPARFRADSGSLLTKLSTVDVENRLALVGMPFVRSYRLRAGTGLQAKTGSP